MVDRKQVAEKQREETKALPAYDFRKGCPRCGQIPRNDFPFAQHHLPMAWPALMFHSGTMHPGTELPVSAPVASDDEALETLMVKGTNPDGSKRIISYRLALQEAITVWLNEPRARD